MRLWAGKQMLLVVLMGALLSACSTVPCKSPYQVIIPTLEASPLRLPCNQGLREETCLLLLDNDYRKIVRELKAACLALGGSTESCQTQAANQINMLSLTE